MQLDGQFVLCPAPVECPDKDELFGLTEKGYISTFWNDIYDHIPKIFITPILL